LTATQRKAKSRLRQRERLNKRIEDLKLSTSETKVAKRLYNIFVDCSKQVARNLPFRLTLEEIAEVRAWTKTVRSTWENIDFDKEKNPVCLRRQRLLWKNYTQSSEEDPTTVRLLTPDELARKRSLPPCLARLFQIFLAWHGLNTLFVLKLLRADAGCDYQITHVDCPEMRDYNRVSFANAQFEGLIALEPDANRTAIVVGETEHIISQGHLHVWKGTFQHSGATYFERNEGLFMCIGSYRFPMSLDVGFPLLDDNNDSEL
jgi:hypothetical protein